MAIKCNIAANASGSVPGMLEVSLGHPSLLAESDRNSFQQTWAEWKFIGNSWVEERDRTRVSDREEMGTQQVTWPYFATH